MPLDPEEIRKLISSALPDGSHVEVRDLNGTGDHFEARVMSPAFRGKSMVEQHQIVYGPLKALISTNTLHALALRTYSPEQWEQHGKSKP